MDLTATDNPSAAGDERYRATRRVTLVGAVVNLVLAVAKILFGIVGQSQALVVDGVHSLSDLASDAMVMFAAKHANRDADEDHPYGHGRIETVATVVLGVFLILIGIGLGYDAGERLFRPQLLTHPAAFTLLVALLSVFAKEGLYHYTTAVARRVRSSLLHANAWHHRSDAISSVIVVIGIGGTLAGLPYLDSLAAVGVAFMIAKIGWDLSWHSLRELVDTALDAEQVAAIRQAIMSVDGVRALHMLRTRRSGGAALVDVHIIVDATLSVSEGHQIGEKVRTRLLGGFDEVTDVTVHIDPEDDEQASPSNHLPLREEMLDRIRKRWSDIDAARRVENVTLHYLDGKVHAEVVLPLDVAAGPEQARTLSSRLVSAAKRCPEVGEVTVYYH
ncbi:MAG TPA: cation diffusion facilitator family transporter [Gammaproteobacteria bacterium]|nr:cation diffusion facilitator family transporter [Gammaproteobacteria bacterium]